MGKVYVVSVNMEVKFTRLDARNKTEARQVVRDTLEDLDNWQFDIENYSIHNIEEEG